MKTGRIVGVVVLSLGMILGSQLGHAGMGKVNLKRLKRGACSGATGAIYTLFAVTSSTDANPVDDTNDVVVTIDSINSPASLPMTGGTCTSTTANCCASVHAGGSSDGNYYSTAGGWGWYESDVLDMATTDAKASQTNITYVAGQKTAVPDTGVVYGVLQTMDGGNACKDDAGNWYYKICLSP
jgi:hypothetical protein